MQVTNPESTESRRYRLKLQLTLECGVCTSYRKQELKHQSIPKNNTSVVEVMILYVILHQ